MFRNLFKRKRYFIVTSHGQTATMFLALNFDNHEEVFCTHSYHWPIIEAIEKLKLELSGANLLDNVNKYFWDLTLNDFFDEHKDATQKRVIGNIHAYTFSRFWQLLPGLRSTIKRNLKVLNMIRHPITRINSCFNHWKNGNIEKFPFIDLDYNINCSHILKHLAKKNKSFQVNYENKAFIVAILQSEHVAQDIYLADKFGIGHILFEEIIKDRDYFMRIFNTLTTLTPKIESEFMFNVKNNSMKHSHNKYSYLSPKEQFDKWKDWQKEAFTFICRENSMKNIYYHYNYDLSFVRP